MPNQDNSYCLYSSTVPIKKIIPFLSKVLVLTQVGQLDMVSYNELKTNSFLQNEKVLFDNMFLSKDLLFCITETNNCYLYNLNSRIVVNEIQLMKNGLIGNLEYNDGVIIYTVNKTLCCQDVFDTTQSYSFYLGSTPLYLYCYRNTIFVFCDNNYVYSFCWKQGKMSEQYTPLSVSPFSYVCCHNDDCYLYSHIDNGFYSLNLLSRQLSTEPLKTGIQDRIISISGGNNGIYCLTSSALYFTNGNQQLQLVICNLKDVKQINYHKEKVFYIRNDNRVCFMIVPKLQDSYGSLNSSKPISFHPVFPPSPRKVNPKTFSSLSDSSLYCNNHTRKSSFITNNYSPQLKESKFEASLFVNRVIVRTGSRHPSYLLSEDAFCAVKMLNSIARDRIASCTHWFLTNSSRLMKRIDLMRRLFSNVVNDDNLKDLHTITMKLLGFKNYLDMSDKNYINILKVFYYDLDTDIQTLDQFLGDYRCLFKKQIINCI